MTASPTGAQIAEQAQNLHLHGDIQRGGRFVGNQQPGFRREGNGDHRPLAHAAGKFVRIAIEPILRVRDTDLAQQGQRILPRLTAVCRKVKAATFCNLFSNGHHRIEMAGRVLENHADFPAAHRRHLPFAEGQDIPAVQQNLTAGNLQSGPGSRRISARQVTVFPDPLSPTSPSISPASSVNETLSTSATSSPRMTVS